MAQKNISLFTAIIINMSIMVGAGIFIFPPLMARIAGSWGFLGWLLSALIFLPIVWSISHITKIFPEEGSFFNYSRRTLGLTVGFLSGWSYALGYIAVQALQTIAIRDMITTTYGIAFFNAHPILFNALVFAILCSLSLFNLSVIGRIQTMATLFKLFPLILVCAIGPFMSNAVSATKPITTALFTLPMAIFGYIGFEMCCSISHRIKGEKNASRAVIIGFLLTALIYTVFHFSLQRIMGNALLTTNVDQVMNSLPISIPFLSSGMTILISAAILVSIVSCSYAALTGNSFALKAMASQNVLFASHVLKKTNKHDQPAAAIFLQGFIGFIFASLLNDKPSLAIISNLGFIIAYAFTLVGLTTIYLKRRKFISLLYVLAGIVSCLVLSFYSINGMPSMKNLLPFALLLLGGYVMFKMQRVFK